MAEVPKVPAKREEALKTVSKKTKSDGTLEQLRSLVTQYEQGYRLTKSIFINRSYDLFPSEDFEELSPLVPLSDVKRFLPLNFFFGCNIQMCEAYSKYCKHLRSQFKLDGQDVIVVPKERQIKYYHEALLTIMCIDFRQCKICIRMLEHVTLMNICSCNNRNVIKELQTFITLVLTKEPFEGVPFNKFALDAITDMVVQMEDGLDIAQSFKNCTYSDEIVVMYKEQKACSFNFMNPEEKFNPGFMDCIEPASQITEEVTYAKATKADIVQSIDSGLSSVATSKTLENAIKPKKSQKDFSKLTTGCYEVSLKCCSCEKLLNLAPRPSLNKSDGEFCTCAFRQNKKKNDHLKFLSDLREAFPESDQWKFLRFSDILDVNLIHVGSTRNRFIKRQWLQDHCCSLIDVSEVKSDLSIRRSNYHRNEMWEIDFCKEWRWFIHQPMKDNVSNCFRLCHGSRLNSFTRFQPHDISWFLFS